MRLVWQLVGTLVVVGLVLHYIWWILAAAVVVALVWGSRRAFGEIGAAEVAEAHRLAAIVKRADQQHAWTLAGDPRGTYGADFPRLKTEWNPTARQRV
jgi:hypothetical protein